ncbi:hypothetical protein [Vibrio coralliilyticus]|uniref:hypothetical protein n=1 Tax=Vibrio coralliilyticus TaxID=190893 RepID=UPI00240A6531|nr:hypothetical protein [Vibrio coralliilyticus]WFB47935.1 hypothetical protein P6988_01560 [Vibrio coralliilyticus]
MLIKYILPTLFVLTSSFAYSSIIEGKKIVEFKSHAEPYSGGSSWDNASWITFEGVTSVGDNCQPQPWSNGLAPFYIDGESETLFSLALAAKLADRKVKVYVRHYGTTKGATVCKLEYLGLDAD